MDRYSHFAELAGHEREGEDFTIIRRERDSHLAVVAPHGGGIEPGTIDIADAIAAGDFTFYAFKGIKTSGNRVMHLTSNRFDEPAGLAICQNASVVVSVHGARDRGETIFIGGLNQPLKHHILKLLTEGGFSAVISAEPGLRGIDPDNICNRCQSGKGVQLEISRGLREKMFEHLECRSLRRRTRLFYRFVGTVKRALSEMVRDPGAESRSH